MKWYTHIMCSVMLALMVDPSQVMLASVASVLPDAVERALFLEHRNPIVHNYVFALLFLPTVFMGVGGLFLGVLHHILLDNLTVSGVYLFDKRIGGFMNTYNRLHNLLVILAHLIAYTVFV